MMTLLIDCALPRSISSEDDDVDPLAQPVLVSPSMQHDAGPTSDPPVHVLNPPHTLDSVALEAVMAAPDESYAATSARLMCVPVR